MDLNAKRPTTEDETPHYYNYQITFKEDRSVVVVNGYLVVTSLFVAICRGKGEIFFVAPFETVARTEVVDV